MTSVRKFTITIALVIVALVSTAAVQARSYELQGYYQDLLVKARKGDTLAMYDLAGLYFRGVGTDQDTSKALYWYQESAQAGYPAGAYKLGDIFSESVRVSTDIEQAFNWYKMAADQGYEKARRKVSSMYAAGAGVEQDVQMAEQWARPPRQEEAEPSTLDIIANNIWRKREHHAVYLPSMLTKCEQEGGELVCVSRLISGQRSNKRYTYRVKSTLKNFTAEGHFDADVKYELFTVKTAEMEAFGEDDEDEVSNVNAATIVQELKSRNEKVSCNITHDLLPVTCINEAGRLAAYSVRAS